MATFDPETEAKLRTVLEKHPRYPREAFEFVSEAIAYTSEMLGRSGHVSGQELSDGCRQLAIEQFGFMARRVLESWNVRTTDDFGRLVYAMIEEDLLRKADGDSIEDFHNVFDFEDAFDRSFRIELESNLHA